MSQPVRSTSGSRWARAAMCASLLLVSVCGDPAGPTGPSSAANGSLRASLAVTPLYPASASAGLLAAAVTVDNVHIVMRRSDGSIALDTIVTFPPGVDEIEFQGSVKLHGAVERLV